LEGTRQFTVCMASIMFNLKQFLINIITIIISFIILHIILFGSVYVSYMLTGIIVNLDVLLTLILIAELHIAFTIIFKKEKK
jgi:hypothetical protein